MYFQEKYVHYKVIGDLAELVEMAETMGFSFAAQPAQATYVQ